MAKKPEYPEGTPPYLQKATPYGRAMHRQRREAERTPKGKTDEKIRKGELCGAKKRHGGRCTKPAGWATNHVGIGCCKYHGGSVPNHVKAAAKEEHRRLLGSPRIITAEDALMECIYIRSGEVKWLSDRMVELDKVHWTEDTMMGKQFHLYARERSAAIRDVARFSQMAMSLNIEERRVRLAEAYGNTIAVLLRRILDDLLPHLDIEGKKMAPSIVRTHLLALSSGDEEAPKAA